jgi:transketolase
VTVLNVPVIKPLDGETILAAAAASRLVISAENHSVIGGLGSAVAEILAGAGLGVPLLRVGIADVFAEAGSRDYLFARYGLDTQAIVRTAWQALGQSAPIPQAIALPAVPGSYAPV